MQKKITHISFVSCSNSIIKFIFLAFFFVIVPSNAKAQWEPITPAWGNGVIRTLIEVKGTIYAGTETSGVFASTDKGINWIPKNNELPSTGVLSIIYHNDVLYAGVYEKGLFRSTDGGTTWSHHQTVFDSEIIVALRSTSTALYVATLYGGVFSSTDTGKTWTKRTNSLPKLLLSTMDVKGKMIVLGTSNGVEVSTDDGDTWVRRLVTGSTDIIDVKIVDENTLVVLTDKAMRISRDSGLNWNINGPPVVFGTLRTMYSDKENNIYFGTENGLTYTTDKGNSWIVKNIKNSKPTMALIAIDSLIITCDVTGNIFISRDKGNVWIDVGQQNFFGGAFANNNIIFAFNPNVQFESHNHGDSWIEQKSFTSKFRYGYLNICSGDTIVMALDDTVRISTDNGERWKSFRVEGRPVKPILIQKNKIIVNAKEGIRSVDIENGNIKEFDFGIKNYGYAEFISHNSTVFMNGLGVSYISFNEGKTWKYIPDVQQNYIDFRYSLITDKGTTYLATDIGLLCTKDSGLTWEKITIGTETVFTKLVLNKNTLFAKGRSNNIYFSSDNGKVWKTLDKTGLPQYFQYFFSDDEYLYITNSRVYRYRIADILISNTPEEHETVTIDNDAIALFPNPATDEITIKGISTASLITYTFTDILGTVITQGIISEQTNTYTLSTQHIPPGFYNVTFQMNGAKHTEKLTVVH